VQALPTLVALATAILVTPSILRHLSEEGLTRENYRGAQLPFPGGVAIVAAAIVALVPLALLQQLADADLFAPQTGLVVTFALGVALLGLIDDLLAGRPRGWRGHGAAVLRGGFSTGALKAVGTLGLALFVLSGEGYDDGRYLLAVALLVLTTNLFNLLDLRPGRSAKGFVLLAAALTLGAWDAAPLEALGLFAAPVLVAGLYDLRERAMLGDTGANLIGGLAGLWLILTLGTTGQAIALAVVLALTVYGEFRSLSALIERTPLLRHLDSIGRNAPHA
jgi:UDP-N-acetylmuramyl pentapeptide phosphotransferase/UDP-N-acetylglucosamine-1-phosphate transferase